MNMLSPGFLDEATGSALLLSRLVSARKFLNETGTEANSSSVAFGLWAVRQAARWKKEL